MGSLRTPHIGLILYWLLLLCGFVAISLETFTYSGFLAKHLLFDARLLFLPILIIGLILHAQIRKKPLFTNNLLKINNNFILPITLALTLFFTLLEKIHYPNYVFAIYHIHYDYLFYAFLLSFLTTLCFLPRKVWNNYKNQILFLFPFLFLGFAFLIRLWPNDTFFYLSKEDYVIEYSQFAFFAAATFFSLSQLFYSYKRKAWIDVIFFSLLFPLLFFISGEEISWGQRIFGIQSSSYLQVHNAQKETTIHNLHGIHEYQPYFHLVFSFVLTTGWIFIKLLPKKLFVLFSHLTPSVYISTYFLVNVLTTPYTEWQEYVELLLSIGLFLFVFLQKKRS